MRRKGHRSKDIPNRYPKRLRLLSLACILTPISGVLIFPQDAMAQLESERPGDVPWLEVSTGIDATEDSWLVYSGATLSPFSHIHAIA